VQIRQIRVIRDGMKLVPPAAKLANGLIGLCKAAGRHQ
jgi:hypothetical protein